MKRFSGIVVPPFTMFHPDLTVNAEAQALLTKHVIANGADVLFLCGSTGEGQFLQQEHPAQRATVIEATIRARAATGRDVPVIVGIYGDSPDEVLDHVDQVRATHAGQVDGIVLSPPLNLKIDESHVQAYFKTILEAMVMPAFLYNNPSTFGGNVIPVDACEACMDSCANLVGVKDSSKNMTYKSKIMAFLAKRDTGCYYEGGEGAFFACLDMAPAALAGRVGCVPSISNVLNLPSRIRVAFESGDKDGARQLQAQLDGIRNRIYHEPTTKGKAQRGGKLALAMLYPGTALDAPPRVHPAFDREVSAAARDNIQAAVDESIEAGHVSVYRGA